MKVWKKSEIAHGLLCLTFDDAKWAEWLPALKIFARFRAHATFFFHGAIGKNETDAMQVLLDHGHSVGLHSLDHADAPPFFEQHGAEAYIREQIMPQLTPCREAGIPIRYFAYPNNRRTEETDRALSGLFRKFRAGLNAVPPLPKGFRIADQSAAFVPVDSIEKDCVLHGCGVGDYYATTQENLDSALDRAAEKNEMLCLFSHGISENAPTVHMKTAILIHLLEKAEQLGILCASFDELPE